MDIRRILIANRGEIAVRVIRACRELGIDPIAAYEPDDRGALHVALAAEAREVDSYLDADALVAWPARLRCRPSRLRLPGRERRLRRGGRTRRPALDRPPALRHAGAGRQDRSAPAGRGRRRPRHARLRRSAAGRRHAAGRGPAARLPAAREGCGRRRRPRHAGGGRPRRPCRRDRRGPSRGRRGVRGRPRLPRSGGWPPPATSRCRSCATPTAAPCTWANATARSSGATRRSSRSRRRRPSTASCARSWAKPRWRWPRRPGTRAQVPSSSCSTPTAAGGSWS